NVLVGEDGRPRVSDFGLAASVDRPEPTDALMGTPAYMAPELIEGSTADARSDQFGFCVLAWECLYGVRPFAGATLAAMALAADKRELQRPAKTDVPPRVRDTIERGLRLDPGERHRDMPALVTALRDATMPRAPGRIAIAIGAACVSTVALGITLVSH